MLAASKRLNTAYLLKEFPGQLRDYTSEARAMKFLENWGAQLNQQRLEPCEEIADMIERHWDGIAACGLRDDKYLRLKILTRMLPGLWSGKIDVCPR